MTRFTINFGARNAPRLVLDIMARSSFEALEQHLCLALPNERMSVEAV